MDGLPIKYQLFHIENDLEKLIQLAKRDQNQFERTQNKRKFDANENSVNTKRNLVNDIVTFV